MKILGDFQICISVPLKHKKKDFYAKTFLCSVIFCQVLALFKFLKSSYVLL